MEVPEAMRNRILILGFRVVFLVLCAIGIMGHLSIDDPIKNINALAFFTILSNLLCFFVVFNEARHDMKYLRTGKVHRYGNMYYQLKGVALLVITITCLAYNYLLTPMGFSMVEQYEISVDMGASDRDKIVHFIVPLLMWLDYLLLQKKGHYDNWDPVKWMFAPVIYYVFIMIRAKQVTKVYTSRGIVRYPYFFLDVDKYGVEYVVKYVVLFIILSLVVGYVIRTIDFLGKMIYTKVINYANSTINVKTDRSEKR